MWPTGASGARCRSQPMHQSRVSRGRRRRVPARDRKSTRLNSSHQIISYAVCCLKKKMDLKGYASLAQTMRADDESNVIGRIVVMGSIFRTFATIEWNSVSGEFEEPAILVGPIAS